jgi:hypothetical protein
MAVAVRFAESKPAHWVFLRGPGSAAERVFIAFKKCLVLRPRILPSLPLCQPAGFSFESRSGRRYFSRALSSD